MKNSPEIISSRHSRFQSTQAFIRITPAWHGLATLYGEGVHGAGGTISFSSRFLGGALIFFGGTQLIYYGMKLNGSAHQGHPVWEFVRAIHFALICAIIAALALVALAWVASAFLSEKYNANQTVAPQKARPTPEQIEAMRMREKKAAEEIAVQARIAEEQRQLEKSKRQEAIMARRKRSARDAARAGLDDFL